MPGQLTALVVAAALAGPAACASAPAAARPSEPAAPAAANVPAGGEAKYDVVIRGGRVLDGAGNPWILADSGSGAGAS
jgi:curli biogenesis system outer membrane secretion channel CsgG